MVLCKCVRRLSIESSASYTSFRCFKPIPVCSTIYEAKIFWTELPAPPPDLPSNLQLRMDHISISLPLSRWGEVFIDDVIAPQPIAIEKAEIAHADRAIAWSFRVQVRARGGATVTFCRCRSKLNIACLGRLTGLPLCLCRIDPREDGIDFAVDGSGIPMRERIRPGHRAERADEEYADEHSHGAATLQLGSVQLLHSLTRRPSQSPPVLQSASPAQSASVEQLA
jgi:hypothetical protein